MPREGQGEMKCKPNSKNMKMEGQMEPIPEKTESRVPHRKTGLRVVQRPFSGLMTGVVWLQMRWRQQQHHSQYPGLGRKAFLAIEA